MGEGANNDENFSGVELEVPPEYNFVQFAIFEINWQSVILIFGNKTVVFFNSTHVLIKEKSESGKVNKKRKGRAFIRRKSESALQEFS